MVTIDVAGGSENVVVNVVDISEDSVDVVMGPGPNDRELSPMVSVGPAVVSVTVAVSVAVVVSLDVSVVDVSVIDAEVTVEEEEEEEEEVVCRRLSVWALTGIARQMHSAMDAQAIRGCVEQCIFDRTHMQCSQLVRSPARSLGRLRHTRRQSTAGPTRQTAGKRMCMASYHWKEILLG